jgi:hypothetical protein
MEARAHATLQDSRQTAIAMHRAETARAATGDDPPWMDFLDQYYLTNQFAYCCRELDETKNMLRFATESLPNSTGRQIVSNKTYIACAQLDSGDPEGACRTAIAATELAAGLSLAFISCWPGAP